MTNEERIKQMGMVQLAEHLVAEQVSAIVTLCIGLGDKELLSDFLEETKTRKCEMVAEKLAWLQQEVTTDDN